MPLACGALHGLDPVVGSGVYTPIMHGLAKRLTIGRLAQQSGVNLETVRYYERRGLLAKPPRTASGYRLFPSDAAGRLRFIKRAQELGFSLDEIRELLAFRVRPRAARAEIRARVEAKIADIDRKIRDLTEMKSVLRQLNERCDSCGPTAACPILRSLDGMANEDGRNW